MGVSLLTALTIANNETQIIETTERCECWMMRDGRPHALLLSCPADKRPDLEAAVESLRKEYGDAPSPNPEQTNE